MPVTHSAVSTRRGPRASALKRTGALGKTATLSNIGVALVAIGLLAATACSANASTVPESLAVQPAPVGVPRSDQTNISPYPAIERLGRWDGTTFVPVAAGSVPAENTIVMSHGWTPGYLAIWQELQQSSDRLVTYWDPGMKSATDGDLLSAGFAGLAAAVQGADPSATVIMFSWADQSSTALAPLDAYATERATEVNGHRLATALDEALAPGFADDGGLVHLIGHSFGANVATTAALALTDSPRQLTLFDSPEINLTEFLGLANLLRYKLTRLDIGRGPDQTFVDNYRSLLGERYSVFPGLGQVADIELLPPPSDPGDLKHEFPIGWYATSASTPGSQVGYAWSPLAGADVSTVGSLYTQSDASEPLQLDEVFSPPPGAVDDRIALAVTPLVIPGGDNDNLTITGNGPTTANTTFTTDESSLWLTFDATVTGQPGDTLQLFIDGRQRWVAAVAADGDEPGDGDAVADGGGGPGQFVILYDIEPGQHVLSVVVGGPQPDVGANPITSATLGDLAVVSASDLERNSTPERTRDNLLWILAIVVVLVISLVAVIVVALVRWRRRRRARRLQ